MLAVYLEQGQVVLKDAAVPARPPGFALLQLTLGGICNTDLELQRGYYNFNGVPGHEFVARVSACDNPSLLGKRVVGEINLACGDCDFCSIIHMPRHCRHRSVLGILQHPGAFSEFFTLPESNLHVVPDEISDAEAVFTEPLAAACEIFDQVNFQPGVEVAVIGDGKLGLLVTQVLLAKDFKVTLYGRHQQKLQIGSAGGAKIGLSTYLPQAHYLVVVECSGSPEGIAAAIKMVCPRGTVIMKSTIHDQVSIDMASVIVNEVVLLGSRCGRFEPALELLRSRRVDVRPMIAAEYPLSEAPAAFRRAAAKGVLKVLLRNDQAGG